MTKNLKCCRSRTFSDSSLTLRMTYLGVCAPFLLLGLGACFSGRRDAGPYGTVARPGDGSIVPSGIIDPYEACPTSTGRRDAGPYRRDAGDGQARLVPTLSTFRFQLSTRSSLPVLLLPIALLSIASSLFTFHCQLPAAFPGQARLVPTLSAFNFQLAPPSPFSYCLLPYSLLPPHFSLSTVNFPLPFPDKQGLSLHFPLSTVNFQLALPSPFSYCLLPHSYCLNTFHFPLSTFNCRLSNPISELSLNPLYRRRFLR